MFIKIKVKPYREYYVNIFKITSIRANWDWINEERVYRQNETYIIYEDGSKSRETVVSYESVGDFIRRLNVLKKEVIEEYSRFEIMDL